MITSKEERMRRRHLRQMRREQQNSYMQKDAVWWMAFGGVLLLCGVIRYLERRFAASGD